MDAWTKRRVTIALGVITALTGNAIIGSFWPGSVGWDYDIVLKESVLWSFRGHQPASAGVFAWILTFGSGQPASIFVFKAVAHFAAALIVVFSRAPLIVRIGAVLLVLSPMFLYHSPLIRTNSMEAAFLGLALAVGATGGSRAHNGMAFTFLTVAAMNSQSLGPGHVGLIMLWLLWHDPDRSFRRVIAGALPVAFAMWALVSVTNMLAGNPDRSSTLYASALNGIGGLHERGVETCLSQALVRGSERTPDDMLDAYHDHPELGAVLWRRGKEGLRPPLFLSEEQRNEVWTCWQTMALGHPVAFAKERIKLALASLSGGGLEPQFVYVRDGPWLVWLNGVRDLSPVQRAVTRYGEFGVEAGVGTVRPYLLLVLLTGAAVAVRARRRRWFVAVAIMTIGGFMAPQLLLAQGISFRYYLVTAYMCGWISLTFCWLLVAEGTSLRAGRNRHAE